VDSNDGPYGGRRSDSQVAHLSVEALKPWLPHGREAGKDERRAIQLAAMPVIPSIIRPQSPKLAAFLTVATLGIYAAYWLRINGDAFHRATERDERSHAIIAVLALCTCMLSAFPALYALQHNAYLLCQEQPKSARVFLLLVVVNIVVPFSGLAIAIALCQHALNQLEHRARLAHGHALLVPSSLLT
jgi:Domain of unknown function (DUF4234)